MDYITSERDKREMTFVPPLMALVSLFPTEKTAVLALKRTTQKVSVSLKVKDANDWASGRTVRAILMLVEDKMAKAKKNDDPDVDAETRTITFRGSARKFCESLGFTFGNGTMREIASTIENMSKTYISVEWAGDAGDSGTQKFFPITEPLGNMTTGFRPEAGVIARLHFSSDFWDLIYPSRVPLNLLILKRLGRSVKAMDVYSWLAYRNNSLSRPMKVTWRQLYTQFENDVPAPMDRRKKGTRKTSPDKTVIESERQERERRHGFRRQFTKALNTITALWPGLNVECDRSGVTLYPSSNHMDVVFDGDTPTLIGADAGSSVVSDRPVDGTVETAAPVGEPAPAAPHKHTKYCKHVVSLVNRCCSGSLKRTRDEICELFANWLGNNDCVDLDAGFQHFVRLYPYTLADYLDDMYRSRRKKKTG